MTEKDIQQALYNEFVKRSLALIPNTYHYGNESDLFRIMKNLMVTEYEIKISIRDFKKDFKKGKHFLMERRIVRPVAHFYRSNKSFRDAKSPEDAKSWTIPNRFAFVVPEGLIGAEDVPEYAGLYYINNFKDVQVIKKPPLLHKEKLGKRGMARIISVLSHRIWK